MKIKTKGFKFINQGFMKKIILIMILVLAMTATAAVKHNGIIDANTDLTANNVENVLLNQNPDPVTPGNYVEIRIKVQNNGDEDRRNLEFKLEPKYPFSLDPDDDGIRKIGTLYARIQGKDGAILYYKLKVDEDAVEGRNELRLMFKTKYNEWQTLTPFDVRIQTNDAILSVEKVEIETPKLVPGKATKVKITLKNMADSVLKNIKVRLGLLLMQQTATTFSYQELPFAPIGTTNELTLEKIEGGEEQEIVFNLMADPDTEAKTYKVPLYISYNDELNTNYSISNSVIGLIVGDTPKLTVVIDDNTVYKKNVPGIVTLKFINKDTTDVKFLDVKVKENGNYKMLSPTEYYVGNIDSDDFETAEFQLYPTKSVDKLILPITIEYKDANNNEYKKEFDLTVRLPTSSEAKQLGLEEGSPVIGFFIVILIVVGGYFGYKKYYKKEKKV